MLNLTLVVIVLVVIVVFTCKSDTHGRHTTMKLVSVLRDGLQTDLSIEFEGVRVDDILVPSDVE